MKLYCPLCNKEYDSSTIFCPDDGTKLIIKEENTDSENSERMNIRLGDANAISGGVHYTDSHNITNLSVNRSEYEIQLTNEREFIKAVRLRVAGGLTRQKEAEISQIARDYKINPIKANLIIEAERKSAAILADNRGNEYYASNLLGNIQSAIDNNQSDIAQRLFSSLEELSKSMEDDNVQFYYYLLFASFNPAGCTVSYINHHTDNYWQLFWTYIAYVKLGQIQQAVSLLPMLGRFGKPLGDIDVLTAIQELYDFRQTSNQYYIQQLLQHLDSAMTMGISEKLQPLWYSVQELTNNSQNIEIGTRFFIQNTLAELANKKEALIPPPLPKFDPQQVNLAQMQGWNPLQAANQMGLGKGIPSMQESLNQLQVLQAQVSTNGMSQMPGTMNMPPMPPQEI